MPVDIRNICVLLAPGFSGLTAYATYLFTNEMCATPSAGLLAAIFMGIAPGYISRSVAGSYDNEAIAIFLLVFTFYLWIKAVKLGSAFWGALCALFYGYMVSAWGGVCFYYESDSSACLRPGSYGSIQPEALCELHEFGMPLELWPACRSPSLDSYRFGVVNICLHWVCASDSSLSADVNSHRDLWSAATGWLC